MELLKPRAFAFSLIALASLTACASSEKPATPVSAPQVSTAASDSLASPTSLKTPGSDYPLADGTCVNPDSVSRYSAESVGRAFIGISYCWDSTIDAGMQSGTERARPLMSEQWAQAVLEGDQSQRRNTLQYQFTKASEHQAYTKLRIYRTSSHLDGHSHIQETPSGTQGEATSQESSSAPVLSEEGYETATVGYTVYWDWVGRDGVNLPGGKAQVMVYLEKRDDGWTVVGAVPTIFEES